MLWGKRRQTRRMRRLYIKSARLAVEMVALSGDSEALTGKVWRYWVRRPDVISGAMAVWFAASSQIYGEEMVSGLVRAATENLGNAPVRHASSRAVFCDMLYAMQDRDISRVHLTWAAVRESEDWLVAVEVTGMMLGLFGPMFRELGVK